MSLVFACPICGNSIMGPTSPPSLDALHTEIGVTCHRCDSDIVITLHVQQVGARASTIPPVKTSK